jgi:hypothetical protein
VQGLHREFVAGEGQGGLGVGVGGVDEAAFAAAVVDLQGGQLAVVEGAAALRR